MMMTMGTQLDKQFELIRRVKKLESDGWTFEQDQNYVKANTPKQYIGVFVPHFLAGKSLEEACSFVEGFMTATTILRKSLDETAQRILIGGIRDE